MHKHNNMKSITPIIIIVISVTLFFIFVNPLYGDVKDLRTDVDSYNQALSHSTELQKVRDDLVNSFNSISKDNKDKLVKFLPNTVDNIELILEIQQIAGSHGMSLTNITFEPPKNTEEEKDAQGRPIVQASGDPSMAKPYGVFDLEFKTKAHYDTMVSFLKDLEKNLRVVDITSMSFIVPNTKGENVDPFLFDYDIKIKTYWLKH